MVRACCTHANSSSGGSASLAQPCFDAYGLSWRASTHAAASSPTGRCGRPVCVLVTHLDDVLREVCISADQLLVRHVHHLHLLRHASVGWPRHLLFRATHCQPIDGMGGVICCCPTRVAAAAAARTRLAAAWGPRLCWVLAPMGVIQTARVHGVRAHHRTNAAPFVHRHPATCDVTQRV
jgi:hypothetical protein